MTTHKLEIIKASFASCTSKEEVYRMIMEWGKKLPAFDTNWKVEENLVSGCQSTMYLHSTYQEEKLFFSAWSDALISAGLASLLVFFYNGEPPETILKTPPKFLEELSIPASLTPGRANGLASLYVKMKQAALQTFLRSGEPKILQ